MKTPTDTNASAMVIPNCGVKCPLDEMYELYDEILPEGRFDDECALRDGEKLPPGGNPESSTLDFGVPKPKN